MGEGAGCNRAVSNLRLGDAFMLTFALLAAGNARDEVDADVSSVSLLVNRKHNDFL